jgi:hypothetical protein
MKLDRFRAPALAAAAVLMISGAGIAFAVNPSAAAPAPVAPIVQAEPVGPDTDQLQQGDQTAPDAPRAAGAAKTDTDNVEQGDQTTPDAAGVTSTTVSTTVSEKTTSAETETSGTGSEGAADASAQHAACLKVGIDDTVTPNVQSDETGACSLDAGGTDNNGE